MNSLLRPKIPLKGEWIFVEDPLYKYIYHSQLIYMENRIYEISILGDKLINSSKINEIQSLIRNWIEEEERLKDASSERKIESFRFTTAQMSLHKILKETGYIARWILKK